MKSTRRRRSPSPVRLIDKLTLSSENDKNESQSSRKMKSIHKFINFGGSNSQKSTIAHKGRISFGGRNLLVMKQISSCVYEVGHKSSESKHLSRYALKCLPLQSSEEDSFDVERRVQLEISALRQVSHENVIPLLEEECGETDISAFFSDRDSPLPPKNSRVDRFSYILSPLYDMNLHDYIKLYGPIRNEKVLLRFFGAICSGVEAIHSKGMRHNNIHPRNILLKFREQDCKHLISTSEKSVDILPWPIICDFESVSPVTVEISSRWQAAEVAEFHLKNSASAYRAPEIWKIVRSSKKTINSSSSSSDSTDSKRRKSIGNVTINSRADAFSIGCTLYYILFRRHAFKKLVHSTGKQSTKWIATIPNGAYCTAPKFVLYVCLGMMLENPNWRLDVRQILTSILPKGRLTDLATKGIWSEYSKMPGLEYYPMLTECRGMPLTLKVSQATSIERGLNKRAVRMLGKGGTSVVKSLSMVEEDPDCPDDDNPSNIRPSPIRETESDGDNDENSVNEFKKYGTYDSSPSHSPSDEGLLQKDISTRSDFHPKNESLNDEDTVSYVSSSGLHGTNSSLHDRFGFPVLSLSNEEEETGLMMEPNTNTNISPTSVLTSIFHRQTKPKKMSQTNEPEPIPSEITHPNDLFIDFDEDDTFKLSDFVEYAGPYPFRSSSPTKSDPMKDTEEPALTDIFFPDLKKDLDEELSVEETELLSSRPSSSTSSSIVRRCRSFMSSPLRNRDSKKESCRTLNTISCDLSTDEASKDNKLYQGTSEFDFIVEKGKRIVRGGTLRQKRHHGRFRKQTVLKTVYLCVTSDAVLICKKGIGEHGKTLCQVNLSDSEFIDFTMIGNAVEKNGYEFAISFSNPRKPSDMLGLRLIAADESDARTWTKCIEQTWNKVRVANQPGIATYSIDDLVA